MSIFRHMTSGKNICQFSYASLQGNAITFYYSLLFYGLVSYDKLNTIYLCGHVFDLYYRKCIEISLKKQMCQWI